MILRGVPFASRIWERHAGIKCLLSTSLSVLFMVLQNNPSVPGFGLGVSAAADPFTMNKQEQEDKHSSFDFVQQNLDAMKSAK